MPRTRKPKPSDVPDTILDHFARQGPLTATDIEDAMRRFKKALLERASAGPAARRHRRTSERWNAGSSVTSVGSVAPFLNPLTQETLRYLNPVISTEGSPAA
jgi:hypothetical protein